MKETTATYDAKSNSFSIEHTNLVKDLAKEYEKSLIIKPFQIGVQVSLEQGVSVSKPEPVEKAAKAAAKELADNVREEITNLATKLQKLKKDEDAGDKKAADTGEKETKATKKKLDKLAADFGPDVRIAIEAALKDQLGSKAKARSANRSGARGLELNEDFFKEKAGGEVPKDLPKSAKSLASSGKDLSELSDDEKTLREKLSGEIGALKQTVDKQGRGKPNFDLQDFAKENPKEVRGLEAAAEKYAELVSSLGDTVESTQRVLKNFNKLLDGAEKLQDKKEIEKEARDYEKFLGNIDGTLKDKRDAAKAAQDLLKDKYQDGDSFSKLIKELAGINSTTKSGGELKKSGEKIEKSIKD